MYRNSDYKNLNCLHFEKCSGCVLRLDIAHPPIFSKANKFFTDIGYNDLILQAGPPIHWRVRSKLAIRGTSDFPLIGLFREGSHEVCSIPHCLVHHPSINQAIEHVKSLIQTCSLDPYNERTGTGIWRYLQCVVQRETKKVQLSLVINQADEKGVDWVEKLWQMNPNLWHSIWINCNTRRDNRIFGDRWLLMKGEEDFWEQIADSQVYYHPASFGQANLDQFEKLLSMVREHTPSQSRVLELYAGVGVIGLAVASSTHSLECVEVNSFGKKCFEKSLSRAKPEDLAKLSYSIASAEDQAQRLISSDFDVLIVDPPRKGLDPKLLQAISHNTHLKKVIYISCGWDSFERDATLLLNAGWRLEFAECHLFFPGTDHIETLAVFHNE